MEKMPFRPEADVEINAAGMTEAATVSSDWRQGLPALHARKVMLRELELSDAPALLAMLTAEEVSRFISPPPTTVEGFERFIRWTHQQRASGHYICFAIVPQGMTTAVGLFQVRALEPGFGTAEWGFAMGSEYWGTGIFIEGARLVVDFAIETVGVHRLEARSAVQNGRGNGALRKVGAVQEGVLRRAFLRNSQYYDQVLWAILDNEWRQARSLWAPKVH
jgi:RimJ/RimL family protein N-acetyltransferase